MTRLPPVLTPHRCRCHIDHSASAGVSPDAVRQLAGYALRRLPAEPLPDVVARRAVLAELDTTFDVAVALLAELAADPPDVIAWRRDVLLAAAEHRPDPPMPAVVLAWRRGDLAAAAGRTVVRGVRRMRSAS